MLIHLVVLFSAQTGQMTILMRGPRAPSRTFAGARPRPQQDCVGARFSLPAERRARPSRVTGRIVSPLFVPSSLVLIPLIRFAHCFDKIYSLTLDYTPGCRF